MYGGGPLSLLADLLAVSFIVHFVWSYYRTCYRKGYTVDIWHYFLFFPMIAIHFMLPFIRSDLNVIAIPFQLKRTQAHVNEAYFISALGYFCLVIGGSLWRVHLGAGLRRSFAHFIEAPSKASNFLLSSPPLLILNGMAGITIMIGVLLYYFRVAGFGFNLRALLLVTPWLRPIAQFSAFYSTLTGSYCLARFYQHREKVMLAIALAIMFCLLFFGERSNILALLMLTILVFFVQKGRRLKFRWLALMVFVALSLVLLLDALRAPHFSLSSVVGGFLLTLLYGNSFSDTRDFALILSYWDGQHYFGLTYVAGLFAFIPRALSQFRDTWALGVVTATLAGYSPQQHPGFRVGPFGEAYLNFGILGVVFVGLFVGVTIRLIDARMKQAVKLMPQASMRVYSYLAVGMLASVAENSSGASTVYSILFIFLFSWVTWQVLHFLKLVHLPTAQAPHLKGGSSHQSRRTEMTGAPPRAWGPHEAREDGR